MIGTAGAKARHPHDFPQFGIPYFVKATGPGETGFINFSSNAVKSTRWRNGRRGLHREHPRTHSRGIRDNRRRVASGKLAQLFQPFNRLGQEAGIEEGTGTA